MVGVTGNNNYEVVDLVDTDEDEDDNGSTTKGNIISSRVIGGSIKASTNQNDNLGINFDLDFHEDDSGSDVEVISSSKSRMNKYKAKDATALSSSLSSKSNSQSDPNPDNPQQIPDRHGIAHQSIPNQKPNNMTKEQYLQYIQYQQQQQQLAYNAQRNAQIAARLYHQQVPGNIQYPPNQNNIRKHPHNHYYSNMSFHTKYPVSMNSDPFFIPNWTQLHKPPSKTPTQHQNYQNDQYHENQIGYPIHKHYKLSLLSQHEFTLTALYHYSHPPNYKPNLDGLRTQIRNIVREHEKENNHESTSAKAVFERNADGGLGRWRIPLNAYQATLTFLSSRPFTIVQAIPLLELKVVSLARQESKRSYPTPDQLMEKSIPEGLANALAPYQRGGVDFVLNRKGRALIADEMGLGKTIQGIASMACYSEEWPLLVLCPSSARYHWEAEFLQWLGKNSATNKGNLGSKMSQYMDSTGSNDEEDESEDDYFENLSECSDTSLRDSSRKPGQKSKSSRQETKRLKKKSKSSPTKKSMRLLYQSEINVVTNSQEKVLPYKCTRVAICSFGLATNLIEMNKIKAHYPFKCIIVDESHMLKNRKAKRTKLLLPILKAAKRVVMLSGTPAFAKPDELYPQLWALGDNTGSGLWDDEKEFMKKYSKKKSKKNLTDEEFAEENSNHASLHTLLTSTVMIRRMKVDILKSLPQKVRHICKLQIRDEAIAAKVANCMQKLKKGKGVLSKLYRQHNKDVDDDSSSTIEKTNTTEINGEDSESRKNVLNDLFHLAGSAKLPIIIKMLNKWLGDSTKGKICIFAHHLAVLDAIIGKSKLSKRKHRFIRIDGSTHPKERQELIRKFQNNPSVRVAVLGITAAGVAVTLTAASTVWFAELFWTPSILIQAEDRCHRIGQQATVRCMYFIGNGTLDEVLWKLIEKKFRDLGEFVEGKEKLNIVVNTSFEDEIMAMKAYSLLDEDEEKRRNVSMTNRNHSDKIEDLVSAEVIQRDIEELGIEETKEMMAANGETGEDDDNSAFNSGRSNKKIDSSVVTKKGTSESSAICLSDDENEDINGQGGKKVKERQPVSFEDFSKSMVESEIDSINEKKMIFGPFLQFLGMKMFRMYFPGPTFGLVLVEFQKRIVVKKILFEQKKESSMKGNKDHGYEDDSTLQVGDIILGCNAMSIPYGSSISHVSKSLKSFLSYPPVEIIFGSHEPFCKFYQKYLKKLESRASNKKEMKENKEDPSLVSVASNVPMVTSPDKESRTETKPKINLSDLEKRDEEIDSSVDITSKRKPDVSDEIASLSSIEPKLPEVTLPDIEAKSDNESKNMQSHAKECEEELDSSVDVTSEKASESVDANFSEDVIEISDDDELLL